MRKQCVVRRWLEGDQGGLSELSTVSPSPVQSSPIPSLDVQALQASERLATEVGSSSHDSSH